MHSVLATILFAFFIGTNSLEEFTIFPLKKIYEAGDRILYCRIHGIENGQGKLRMMVVDTDTKEALLEQMRFMTNIKIPSLVPELKAQLLIFCRQNGIILGPISIPVQDYEKLITNVNPSKPVYPGQTITCYGNVDVKINYITWVYVSGERFESTASYLKVTAGRTPVGMFNAPTSTYDCVGQSNQSERIKSRFTYEIGSLVKTSIQPKRKWYEVGQLIRCVFDAKLVESTKQNVTLVEEVYIAIRIEYTDAPSFQTEWSQHQMHIPESESYLRDYFLICRQGAIESEPIPIIVIYDHETHIIPKKTNFMPGEDVECNAVHYGLNNMPLFIAHVSVGTIFKNHENYLSAMDAVRRFPTKWYNLTNMIPIEPFDKENDVYIIFCSYNGQYTRPMYITRGNEDDIFIEQVTPNKIPIFGNQVYAITDSTFICTSHQRVMFMEWKCVDCFEDDKQWFYIFDDTLIIQEVPQDIMIEFTCVARSSQLWANKNKKSLKIVIVADYYVALAPLTISRTIQCEAAGTSTFTGSEFHISLPTVVYKYTGEWLRKPKGEDKADSENLYAECTSSFGMKSGKLKVPYIQIYPKVSVILEDLKRKVYTCESAGGSKKIHGKISMYIQSLHSKGSPSIHYKTGYHVPVSDYVTHKGLRISENQFKVVYTCQIPRTLPAKLEVMKLDVADTNSANSVKPNQLVFHDGDSIFCSFLNASSPNYILRYSLSRQMGGFDTNLTQSSHNTPLLITKDQAGYFLASCNAAEQQKHVFVEVAPFDLAIYNVSREMLPNTLILCSAKGYPVPQIKWFHLRGPMDFIRKSGPEINIPQWASSGDYVLLCQAMNSAGNIDQAIAFRLKNQYDSSMKPPGFFIPVACIVAVLFILLILAAFPLIYFNFLFPTLHPLPRWKYRRSGIRRFGYRLKRRFYAQIFSFE